MIITSQFHPGESYEFEGRLIHGCKAGVFGDVVRVRVPGEYGYMIESFCERRRGRGGGEWEGRGGGSSFSGCTVAVQIGIGDAAAIKLYFHGLTITKSVLDRKEMRNYAETV